MSNHETAKRNDHHAPGRRTGQPSIIDFPLSNCANSGIDTVGVLTQYRPLELNSYIGNGQPWDLDRMNGGVYILPPYATDKDSQWYKGTANAIYQNINFIDRYNPENVLILSGDHIYKMDYAKMLAFHKEKKADATIAVLDVSLEEASRFGIMNTNEDDSIYEFEEKPKHLQLAEAAPVPHRRRKHPRQRQRLRQEYHPRYVSKPRADVRLPV